MKDLTTCKCGYPVAPCEKAAYCTRETPRPSVATSGDTPRTDAVAGDDRAGIGTALALARQLERELATWSDIAVKHGAALGQALEKIERLERELAEVEDANRGFLRLYEHWKERALKAEAQPSATEASTEYARQNPLGGPAVVFEAMASRIRAGEDYYSVLRDYDLQHIPKQPPETERTGWIAVGERLPPVNVPVVAMWDFKSVDYYECPYVIAAYNGCNWHNPDDTDDDYAPPQRWMPLPSASAEELPAGGKA